jgi:hypothetical protein
MSRSAAAAKAYEEIASTAHFSGGILARPLMHPFDWLPTFDL